MAEVIAIEHLTLDGVMQAPGSVDEDPRGGFRHGGWANRSQDPDMQEIMGSYMSSAWSLLAGRTTYEQFADYWPKQAPNPIAEALDRVRKYVASTTLSEPLAWQSSTLLEGDAARRRQPLEGAAGREPHRVRQRVPVRSLLPRDLVDTLVLVIHPLVLGSGRRLFPDSGSHLSALRLVDSVTTARGAIVATYEPAEG